MTKKKLFISNGNKKVKANIFNLPSGITCKQGLQCAKYCYAKKAERLYPQVKPCRMNNLDCTKDANFIENMVSELKKKKNKIVRIHEAGDFYSIDYIMGWFSIMNKLPDHQFYAYTKQRELFEIVGKRIHKPKNFTLILSLDGIQEADKGRIDNVNKIFDKVAITHKNLNNCPAATDSDLKCMVDCKKCLNKKKEVIIFKKH